MTLDKLLVAESFSQAATTYDAAAFLQQEVAERLFERLELMNIRPQKVLDVGCGTGFCSRRLRQKFSRGQVTGVDIAPGMIEQANKKQGLFKKVSYLVADADDLPFEANTFDVVFSNLTLQWLPDLNRTFEELNRVLKSGGLLIFSSLGPDTLMELRDSWRQVDDAVHVNDFLDMHIVGDQVFNAKFENTVMDRDVITLTYKTMVGLMRDLKAIGAHNVDSNRPRGMFGKQKFNQLQAEYEKYRWSGGELPATYEVVYGHAWKKQGKVAPDYHTYEVNLQSPEDKGGQ
jgi:malonyl-CoA O-methyltransferase